MLDHTARQRSRPAVDSLVPIREARSLLGRDGKRIAQQTVFALAVRGEIAVSYIAGRFLASRASIDAYLARRGGEAADAPPKE